MGLSMRRRALARDNAALQRQLRALLQGTCVADDAVGSPSSTLLIVNGGLQRGLPDGVVTPPRAAKDPACLTRQASAPKGRNPLAVMPAACLA